MVNKKLIPLGFSYEYLSPDNFVLPEAYVSKGVFAPNRQAFKAMIVGVNEIMTGLGVTKLSEYAHDGLPIIFFGGVPSKFEGYDQPGYESAKSTIYRLLHSKHVHVTSPSKSLADFLASINILPRTSVSANGTWYTLLACGFFNRLHLCIQ